MRRSRTTSIDSTTFLKYSKKTKKTRNNSPDYRLSNRRTLDCWASTKAKSNNKVRSSWNWGMSQSIITTSRTLTRPSKNKSKSLRVKSNPLRGSWLRTRWPSITKVPRKVDWNISYTSWKNSSPSLKKMPSKCSPSNKNSMLSARCKEPNSATRKSS